MGIHTQDKTRQDWSHIASHPTQTSIQFAVVRGPPRGGEWAQAPHVSGRANYSAKFTTSLHRNRSDACIVACIAVDFRSKSANRSEDASHRKSDLLDAHRTAHFACFGTIESLEIAQF